MYDQQNNGFCLKANRWWNTWNKIQIYKWRGKNQINYKFITFQVFFYNV